MPSGGIVSKRLVRSEVGVPQLALFSSTCALELHKGPDNCWNVLRPNSSWIQSIHITLETRTRASFQEISGAGTHDFQASRTQSCSMSKTETAPTNKAHKQTVWCSSKASSLDESKRSWSRFARKVYGILRPGIANVVVRNASIPRRKHSESGCSGVLGSCNSRDCMELTTFWNELLSHRVRLQTFALMAYVKH